MVVRPQRAQVSRGARLSIAQGNRFVTLRTEPQVLMRKTEKQKSPEDPVNERYARDHLSTAVWTTCW